MVMRISIGHSSSAYSLELVQPSGRLIAASTITSCQPQKVKAASLGANSVVWLVRCTA